MRWFVWCCFLFQQGSELPPRVLLTHLPSYVRAWDRVASPFYPIPGPGKRDVPAAFHRAQLIPEAEGGGSPGTRGSVKGRVAATSCHEPLADDRKELGPEWISPSLKAPCDFAGGPASSPHSTSCLLNCLWRTLSPRRVGARPQDSELGQRQDVDKVNTVTEESAPTCPGAPHPHPSPRAGEPQHFLPLERAWQAHQRGPRA